jgi:hypothetical protein
MVFVRLALSCAALLVVAAAADAAENGGSRLVVGRAPGLTGTDLTPAQGVETRLPLASGGGISIGALSESSRASTGGGGLAVGGYVAYGLGSGANVSTSLKADGDRMSADIGAGFNGTVLGHDTSADLRVGAHWGGNRLSSFSLNPMLPGQIAPLRQADDGGFAVSLSLRHALTPSLSLGGMAEASQPASGEPGPSSGFRLGAGVGLTF